jgi:hypothetical protein
VRATKRRGTFERRIVLSLIYGEKYALAFAGFGRCVDYRRRGLRADHEFRADAGAGRVVQRTDHSIWNAGGQGVVKWRGAGFYEQRLDEQWFDVELEHNVPGSFLFLHGVFVFHGAVL